MIAGPWLRYMLGVPAKTSLRAPSSDSPASGRASAPFPDRDGLDHDQRDRSTPRPAQGADSSGLPRDHRSARSEQCLRGYDPARCDRGPGTDPGFRRRTAVVRRASDAEPGERRACPGQDPAAAIDRHARLRLGYVVLQGGRQRLPRSILERHVRGRRSSAAGRRLARPEGAGLRGRELRGRHVDRLVRVRRIAHHRSL